MRKQQPVAVRKDRNAPDPSAALTAMRAIPIAPPVAAALFFFALAAWCVRHGYIGVTHDAALYAFQAIASGDLAYLKDDLYLRYGSQDAYTAFSPIFHAFITLFGFSDGSVALVLVGQVAWIAGAFALFRALAGGSLAATGAAALMIAALDPVYGAGGELKFGEGFATPRLWAEAAVFAALAAFATRRWALATLPFAVALALHPILALIGLGFALLAQAMTTPRILLIVPVGAVAALAGAALDIGPLGALFATFDPDWLAILLNRSPHLFVSAWTPAMLTEQAATLILLLAAAVLFEGALRRWMLAAAAILVIGVASSFIMVDLLGNVLIAQIQPWRAALFARLFVCFALAVLLVRDRSTLTPQAIAALLAVLLTQVATNSVLAMQAIALFAAIALLAVAGASRRPTKAANAIAWLMALAAIAAMLVAVVLEIAEFERLTALLARSPDDMLPIPLEALLIPHFVLLAALIGVPARGKVAGYALAGIAAVTASAGVMQWDQRSEWRIFVDESFGELGDGAFAAAKPGESVLWQGGNGAPPVWFGLTRESYLSRPQGAGLVFNRGTAMEYARRTQIAEPIDNRATTQTFGVRFREAPKPKVDDLIALCADEAAPALVVLTAPLPERPGRVWRAPAADIRIHIERDETGARLTSYAVDAYHIYECADFGG